MNKRQKKKLYRKIWGANPPKDLQYSGYVYHSLIEKPWGGSVKELWAKYEAREQRLKIDREINNLINAAKILTERRRKR